MHEPLAWQQTAAWKGTGWKMREVAPRDVDVHARWTPEREAEEQEEEEEEEEEEGEEETKTEP